MIGKWKELPRYLPDSGIIIKFLKNFGEYSIEETYRTNAPYALGVNGFTVKDVAGKRLFNNQSWINDPVYESLLDVISTCVSYNLLEIRETDQGGKTWDVYYLNRWLCVYFDLPLSYGGFRHFNPSNLIEFIR